MNALDVLIVAPLLYFAIKGFKNGLIREAFSIIGLILAAFLSFQYMSELSSLLVWLTGWEGRWIPILAFALLFAGLIILVHIAIRLIDTFLYYVFLSTPNRVLGFAFGFLKCGILLSVLLIFLAIFDVPAENTRENSATYTYVKMMAPITYDVIAIIYPGAESFAESVQENIDRYISFEDSNQVDE